MAKVLGIDEQTKSEYEIQKKGAKGKKDTKEVENMSKEVKEEHELDNVKKPQYRYIGVTKDGDRYQAKIQVSKKKSHIIGTYELAADAAEIVDRSIKILELDHKTNFRTQLQWRNARETELIENLQNEIGAENLIGVDLSGIAESVDPNFPSEDSLGVKFRLKDDDSDSDDDSSVNWLNEDSESDDTDERKKNSSKRRTVEDATITKKSPSQRKCSSAPDKYIGISRSGTKFQSQIWFNSKSNYLGTFVLSADAAHVYDRAINLCGADKEKNFETKKDYEHARQKELTVINRNGTRASHQSRSLPSDEVLLEILRLEGESDLSEEEESTEDFNRRYKGVYKCETEGRFICKISYKGNTEQIRPRFDVVADAAFLFDKAATIINDGRSLNFPNKNDYLKARKEEINEKKLSVESPSFPSTREIKKILGIDTKDVTDSDCNTTYNGVKRNDSSGKFECRIDVERAGKERVSRDLGVYQLAADAAHVYDRAIVMLSTTVYRKKRSKKALNFKTEKEYIKASKAEVKARGENPKEILPADEDIQRMLGIRTIDTYYSAESQSINLGTKVLKEFGDYGAYEGAVTSLPSSKTNYYFVTYDDGDGEDLFLSELQPLVEAYRQKYKVDTSLQKNSNNKDPKTDDRTKRKSSPKLDNDSKDRSRKRSNSTHEKDSGQEQRARKKLKLKKFVSKKKRRKRKEENRKRKEEMSSITKEKRQEKSPVENIKEKSTSESSKQEISTVENIKKKSMTESSKQETVNVENAKKRSTSESSKQEISTVENMKEKPTSESSKDILVVQTTKERDADISDSDIEVIEVKKPSKETSNTLHISDSNDSEVQIIGCKTPVKKKRKKSTEPAVVTPSSINIHRVKGTGNKKTTCCVEGCNAFKNLQYCSRCHDVLYCSRICQRNDWPRHKADCRKK